MKEVCSCTVNSTPVAQIDIYIMESYHPFADNDINLFRQVHVLKITNGQVQFYNIETVRREEGRGVWVHWGRGKGKQGGREG